MLRSTVFVEDRRTPHLLAQLSEVSKRWCDWGTPNSGAPGAVAEGPLDTECSPSPAAAGDHGDYH